MPSLRKYKTRTPSTAHPSADAAAPAANDAPTSPTAAVGAAAPVAEIERSPLQDQLDATRNAEAATREHARRAEIEQIRTYLKSHGASEAKIDFLIAHPAYLDPRVGMSVWEAHQRALADGVKDDSPEMFAAIVRDVSERKAAHIAAQIAADVPSPAAAAPPPPPAPEPVREPLPAAAAALPPRSAGPAVSAPVSRDPPSYGGGRFKSVGRVELTPSQREHARIAGISDTEYAANVLELERRKALGMYQERG